MNCLPEERVKELARYIIRTSCTVREAAKVFSVSKSTVHTDMTQRLPGIAPDLYTEVRMVLDINKRERHIRGGKATKEKFASQKM